MSGLADVFAPSSARPTDDSAATTIVQTDPAVIEAQYEALNERRAAAERAATARHDAAIARQIAQSFSAYARALRKVAESRGSVVDRAVDLFLAATCDDQVDEYTALQARRMADADRAGSL